ncbi:hypothetical protein HZC32_03300 [Candidatus Woesearchaeota archaeon]|nr:hypothetical protein [Candidatus Woesearchaeota archaeon]
MTLLLLALVGFLISLPGREAVLAAVSGEPHSMVFDSPPVGKEVAAEEKKPEVKFTPGKYVASKSSNTYHEPKCDWAKKIYPARRIWFNTSGEAKEKGYKAHSCVQ